ncbi:hypothetical protein [Oceanobacillus halophilus]|uniref:Uncharacterized protein n=1 Tax=Oceanobacillus halophilus TaxID=930130 RepID=A0A494ZVB1_9BACI|nr:hypothetical protein [Oceanobacillus halophilus]RKQ30396.1 hypothetical protein D8M06_15935 [Oceanobacillus halophilus]
MKKYIIFAISFLLLLSLFQVISGWFLTFMYTPDVTDAWNVSANLSSEVVIRSDNRNDLLTIFFAFLSAIIAYFISWKMTKN